MIQHRLDRALANEERHSLISCSYTEYLRMVGSDHRPIVAFVEDKFPKRRDSFDSVKDGWEKMVLWNLL